MSTVFFDVGISLDRYMSTMIANRSIPSATVIPELDYDDLPSAVAWLCAAFGFAERLRIADHRAQLTLGTDAAIVVRQAAPHSGAAEASGAAPRQHGCALLVRVDDADAHCARARQHGAAIIRPPTDYPYGERQYTALDPGGHSWTFSQSIADVHPDAWGGILRERGSP